MLRKIRIAAAAFFFVLTTLLFLDFTGTLHAWFGWMAKIQFLPALLALNVGVVAFLVILTLLFGRVYCSVICPLGVMQDIVSWASGKRRKHRNRFAYSPALTWLRRGMLVVFVAAMLAGVGSLLAPYSAYGRIASNLLAPVYAWGNNLLAYIAGRMDSYAFYSVDVWMKSLSTLLVAVVTFAVLFVLAWRSGRTYCNTICPVGTVLGFLARYSLFKPRFDTSKCNGCKLSGRRFFLHTFGFRHRLRLRRPLEEKDVGKGFSQAAVDPSASDGRHGGRDRGRHVLFSGLFRLGCLGGVPIHAADGHAAERAADSGDARFRNQRAG